VGSVPAGCEITSLCGDNKQSQSNPTRVKINPGQGERPDAILVEGGRDSTVQGREAAVGGGHRLGDPESGS